MRGNIMSKNIGLYSEKRSSEHGSTVAVYARSAVDDEAGSACRRQVQAAWKMVEPDTPMTDYVDAARSGMDASRPGLRCLLEDARQAKFHRLIVRDFSRLARDYSLLTGILGELQAAGVEVTTIG